MRSWSHGQANTVSPEVRERAVRMVYEHASEPPSEWAAIASIATKIGRSAQTLSTWIKRRALDRGERPGVSSEEQARVKALEREVKEPRRANGVLRKASAYLPKGSSTALGADGGVHRCRT